MFTKTTITSAEGWGGRSESFLACHKTGGVERSITFFTGVRASDRITYQGGKEKSLERAHHQTQKAV